MAGPVAHARRFGAAYIGLAAIFGAATGLFIVLVERPAPPPPPIWSAWKPQASNATDASHEIAAHVGAQYHLPSGHRLVHVLVRDPAAATNPIEAVALATTLNPTSSNQIQSFVDAKRSVMYILCGAGAKCAIREGKPTLARGAVLRQEALELALYTLKYVKGTDSVVAFFPPKPGGTIANAYFFARSDYDTELHRPLKRTLPHPLPPKTDKLSPIERRIVDQLTITHVFRFSLKRDPQNGAQVLVLARPA